ncbi:MAG: hypothetical protein ACR2LH_00330 [Thermoleophilaceae bacterium]
MSWKPALAGAILVAITGVLVGIAVGDGGDGDGTQDADVAADTRTEPTQKVEPQETETGETETGETDTDDEAETNAEPESEPAPDGGVPLAEAVSRDAFKSQNRGEGFPNDDPCVQPGGRTDVRGLGGEPLTDPVALTIALISGYSFNPFPHTPERAYDCKHWRIVLPVSGYGSLRVARLGWGDAASAELASSLGLNVYADTLGSKPRYSKKFDGPGDVGQMDIDLEGVEQLIFEWKTVSGGLASLPLHASSGFLLDRAYLTE